MKLIVLILLCSLSSAASIYKEDDKNMHLGVSYNLTAATHLATKDPILAGSAVFTLGLIKEFILDSKPDQGDIGANALGVAVGAIIPFRIEF